MQRGSAARSCERGQAMVEFVLIAPLLFLLVGGILQMALALNYWLDMQRIANQGARWAVVARYPLDRRHDVLELQSVHVPGRASAVEVLARRRHSRTGSDPDVCISFPVRRR